LVSLKISGLKDGYVPELFLGMLTLRAIRGSDYCYL
jgi:hypothetical protein